MKLRVLIVEDDDVSREALASAVQVAGATARTAINLAAARACVDAESFDVVLLDLTLPDGDGAELVPEIDRAACDVVFVTGHSDPHTFEDARRRGAVACLVKPVEVDRLWAVLEEIEGRHGSPLA